MPVQVHLNSPDTILLQVSGELTVHEYYDIQSQLEKIIQDVGSISIFVDIKLFEGWEKNPEGWDDWTFADKHDPYIKKIAIVGEPKWKDSVFAFTAKWLRPFEIKFYSSEDQNQAWHWLNS